MNPSLKSSRVARFGTAAIAAMVMLVATVPTAATPVSAQEQQLGRRHAKTRVIVGFKPNASAVRRNAIVQANGKSKSRRLSRLARDTVLMELPNGQTVSEAVSELRRFC